MESREFDSRYEWRAVLLLSAAFGLVGLDRWIIAPLAPAIIADLGLAPQHINFLVAILGVTWGIAAVLMGGLSDRIGRRAVLLPAIVIFSLASGFSALASGLMTFAIIRGTMGVAEGAFAPASFAATAEASHHNRRGFNQGLQQASFALFGLGFGPILATQLLTVMSWRAIFLIVAIPGLILSALLAAIIREPHQNNVARAPQASPVPFAVVLRHRNVPLGMAGLLCAMCGIFVLSANIPLYLTTELGLSSTDMGLVTSAIGFGGFVGQWGLAWLSDHFGRRTMAASGFAGGAVFLIAFMQAGPNVGLLFGLLFFCTAFSFGLLSLLTGPVATEAAPPGMISTAAGLIIGSGEIFGGGLALVVAGAIIAECGIGAMLYLALCGMIAGAVLMLFLVETAPRKLARES
ncbi:MFS transporter [Tardibacter chloracetimidivorans]|uniref:MFS transporter n=1 Tax=Tardibacter chloracetimidivorans TaxID=1921510 RepID=A0A1L3ZZ82_9SPHN|nr:MFS transporter [Tardibacter chloracetimidivorans]